MNDALIDCQFGSTGSCSRRLFVSMGACSSLLNAQVELVALKQLKEQSAVNNEKIAAKNEKHAAEMAELRRELGQAKDDRVREMQELTAKHQQELRRLQQEPMFFLTPI